MNLFILIFFCFGMSFSVVHTFAHLGDLSSISSAWKAIGIWSFFITASLAAAWSWEQKIWKLARPQWFYSAVALGFIIWVVHERFPFV